MSPLYQQLRSDIRPPLCAAELLLSDESLPSPWFGKRGYSQGMSLAGNWLQAHELISAHYEAKCQVCTWTRKGELYRYRIRAAGLLSPSHTDRVRALWDWARAGNGPSVWHGGVYGGRAWS